MRVWPPMVSVADRPVEEAFAAAVTPTEPLPVPVEGRTLAQLALLEAVHEQLELLAVMAIVPTPPEAAYGLPLLEGSMLMLHTSAPSVIWKGWPPICKVPLRDAVVEF